VRSTSVGKPRIEVPSDDRNPALRTNVATCNWMRRSASGISLCARGLLGRDTDLVGSGPSELVLSRPRDERANPTTTRSHRNLCWLSKVVTPTVLVHEGAGGLVRTADLVVSENVSPRRRRRYGVSMTEPGDETTEKKYNLVPFGAAAVIGAISGFLVGYHLDDKLVAGISGLVLTVSTLISMSKWADSSATVLRVRQGEKILKKLTSPAYVAMAMIGASFGYGIVSAITVATTGSN
jgi:hypothetical protein